MPFPKVAALLEFADGYRPRRWAIESAGGLGFLLAQHVVRAGEDVVDVPATLAARVGISARSPDQWTRAWM